MIKYLIMYYIMAEIKIRIKRAKAIDTMKNE
jgi:hypothetical protein